MNKQSALIDEESDEKIVKENDYSTIMSFVTTNKAKPISLISPTSVHKKKKNKKVKLRKNSSSEDTQESDKKQIRLSSPKKVHVVDTHATTENNVIMLPNENVEEKFPILNDQTLIEKFLAVSFTNNQKGRIRQQIRDDLKNHQIDEKNGIYNPLTIMQKIHSIMNKNEVLNDVDLRRIRILHNMLRLATEKLNLHPPAPKVTKKKNRKRKLMADTDGKSKKSDETDVSDVKKHVKVAKLETGVEKGENSGENKENLEKEKNKKEKKGKSVKRYVVFVGNLPFDIDKDTIMRHFMEITNNIKDVRIPTDKKGIAYLELKDEASYQVALSKHHSMMNNRRINVLYTTVGKNNNMQDVKSKTAKLLALQKAGKLMGSLTNKKRSARRKKQKESQKAQESTD